MSFIPTPTATLTAHLLPGTYSLVSSNTSPASSSVTIPIVIDSVVGNSAAFAPNLIPGVNYANITMQQGFVYRLNGTAATTQPSGQTGLTLNAYLNAQVVASGSPTLTLLQTDFAPISETGGVFSVQFTAVSNTSTITIAAASSSSFTIYAYPINSAGGGYIFRSRLRAALQALWNGLGCDSQRRLRSYICRLFQCSGSSVGSSDCDPSC